MKTFCLSLLFFLTLLANSHSIFAQSCPLQLTLAESIERAKAHSRSIEIAEFETLSVIADKNLMRSAFFPHIDLEGVIDNSNRALSDDLTQFQNQKTNKAVGVKAFLGLWDFGVTWKRFKATKLRIDASEMEEQKVYLEVEQQVRSAYLKILETSKLKDVLENAIETLKHQVCQASDRSNEGLLRETDLLAIQVQLVERQRNLLQLNNALISQKMCLNRLIGLPLLQEICLVEIDEPIICAEFDRALQFAMTCRPDLLAFEKQLQALLLERKAVLWSIAPKIYAFANGNYSSRSNSSVGLGLNMPLYHGGQKSAELLKVDAEIGKLEAIIEETNDAVLLEIKNLFLQFDETNSSFALNEKAIDLAQQRFYDAEKLYEQDLLSIQDVLIAQDQLNEAKMGYFSNYYRWHQILAQLYTATGGYPQKIL